MRKEKANSLLLFLQERSNFPLTVVVNAIEEQKTPAISISGQNYSLKFKFYKNGKVYIRAKFSDKDGKNSSYWVSILEKTISVTTTKDKKSEDLGILNETHSYYLHIISDKEDFLRRYPKLRLPKYFNISYKFYLSENCGIDLLKNYVTGGG